MNKRNILLIILCLFIVLFFLGISRRTGFVRNLASHVTSQPTHPAYQALSSGTTQQTLSFEGTQRTYLLHIPVGYTPSQQYPLVLVLHGYGGNAQKTENFTRYSQKADQNQFIVVYPNAAGTPPQWNIPAKSKEFPSNTTADDVGFIQALLQNLSSTANIDNRRIYAVGISNGGGFAYELGCALSDKFAAIGSVSGAPFTSEDCQSKNPNAGPVPLVAFYGTADTIVPYTVAKMVPGWAVHNGCSDKATISPVTTDVTKYTYTIGCRNSADVTGYSIKGGVHTWPGGDTTNIQAQFISPYDNEISATDLTWGFFSAHSK